MSAGRSGDGLGPGGARARFSPFSGSVSDLIEYEKLLLHSPEQGPDELRYLIYRSVFNKVIGQATDYRRLLLAIKAEYDDVIRGLKRREEEEAVAQRTVTSHSTSLMTCQRRANHLRDRISELQRETSELEEQLQSQRSCGEQSMWIPGLTMAESEDPEALDRRLRQLQVHRAALLDRRSLCVSQRLKVKAKLDTELQIAESLRHELGTKSQRLKVLFSRIRCVCDHLSRWEGEVPLQEVVGSSLENIRQNRVDDEVEPFGEEEPTGDKEVEPLTDHLDRFSQLLDSAQFEEACLVAARSPGGVLRSCSTMTLFKAVQNSPTLVPPPLLFFRALLVSASPTVKLSALLSVEGVALALQCGAWQLVVHAVTQNKLTCTERLGDVLTEHAQKNPGSAHLCLVLAAVVYKVCGQDRKCALSMCRSSLVHSAAEFIRQHKDFRAEDCLWVLCRSPSLSLLQLMTQPQGRGQAAVMSVGVACSTLLANGQWWELATQLLDNFVHQGVLQATVLEDRVPVDIWVSVAHLCCERGRTDLQEDILSVLLEQDGTRAMSPDLEGAQLMDHVLL